MQARVLCLNPYHGGSHQAFIEGWQKESRHHLDLLTLPPHKWKWRMRHAAVTFARQLAQRATGAACWDALFCTDMLNLAEFLGLCGPAITGLPSVVYFHENQLTYPSPRAADRDLHFAFTNMTSALAARRVWFNSAFHRDEFLGALDQLLRRMPDQRPLEVVADIRRKSVVHPPGIAGGAQRSARRSGPLRIVWAARWEHDKDPQTFFEALRLLHAGGTSFRLSVLGQVFGERPACFETAEREFRDQIDHWGFLPQRVDYERVLADSDVVVSTARHEFFGIAVLEAVAAGCFPIVPLKLAYPEILGNQSEYFHDGSAAGLAKRLEELSRRVSSGQVDRQRVREIARPYGWQQTAARMDDALTELIRQKD